MCAITGYLSLKPEPDPNLRRIFAKLLLAGRCRGTDATGFMYPDQGGNIVVQKAAGGPTNVIATIPPYAPRWMIGHNRQKTKGSPTQKENNHPVISGHFALVHNGVVYERGATRSYTTYNVPGHGPTYPHSSALHGSGGQSNQFPMLKWSGSAEVDTQMLVETLSILTDNKWKTSSAIVRGIQRYLTGSYACVAVDSRHPLTLHVWRETSPLVLCYAPSMEVLFLGSTDAILEEALGVEKEYLDGLISYNELPPDLVSNDLSDSQYLSLTLSPDSTKLNWEGCNLEFPANSTTTVQTNLGAYPCGPIVDSQGRTVGFVPGGKATQASLPSGQAVSTGRNDYAYDPMFDD